MKHDRASYDQSEREVPLDFASSALSRESQFEEYLTIILRGKWIILGVLLTVFALVTAYTFLTPPVFETSAVVLVDTKNKGRGMPIFDITSVGTSTTITNELEILKSRSLREAVALDLLRRRVVDSLRGDAIQIIQPPDDQQNLGELDLLPIVVERLLKNVDFLPVKESDVIKISARSNSATEAALLANTIAEKYVERNLNASRVQSRAVREFLADQMRNKRSMLDTTETAVQRYMRSSGIASLDAEAGKVVEQLSQLEARRDAIDIERSAKVRTLTSLKQELLQLEPNVARSIGQSHDSYIRLLQDQIAKLEVQRDIVIAQNPTLAGDNLYSEKLKEIDGQISLLRKNLEERTKIYMQALVPGEGMSGEGNLGFLGELKQKIMEAQVELDGMAAQRDALEGVIKEYETRFNQIPKKSIDLAKLQRERLSSEKLYLMVEEKYNEAAIKEKSEFGYVSIIDGAVAPMIPISPRKGQNLVLGLVIGLMLGIATVFVRAQLDAKIRTADDLKKLGLIPLSTIGRLTEEIRKIERDPAILKNGRFRARLVAHYRPLSPMAESYRHLRTNLRYARADGPLKVVLVTSSNPQEGKSTTVANLAVSFAQAEQKTLLIDADMRRPTIERTFNLRMGRGLSEILTGLASDETGMKRDVVENLDIIPCGTIPPNPAELLGSNAMKTLLVEMKERYDIILIDSPPLLAVTDAAVLATEADGVVIVTSSGTTRRDDVERALEFLEGIGASSLGVVLNNFDVRSAYGRKSKRYRYGYYNYESGYYREEKKEKA